MDKPPKNKILSDISASLKTPLLPNVKHNIITHEQIHAGVSIHIPHSPLLQRDDLIVLHWGLHQLSTPLLHPLGKGGIVRILCITYNFIPHAQYGPVDLYYEIHRSGDLIGTSPTVRVTVNKHLSVTDKQRRRKRNMKRRRPDL
ncbi:hypothetical protein ALQ04_00503 [Pseudomonas cichorii]|uniref:Uncharacterized protein n=2 Tax=Pseudomonas cichorii TaxID=36746 RepID=A0A3M4LJI2_PSECI|nr:hypothetical protein ALQ04_00503 [Pseudomonas cichorii]